MKHLGSVGKIHVDMIRISMELPGGNLVFDRRKYKLEATKIVHVKPVAVVFFPVSWCLKVLLVSMGSL